MPCTSRRQEALCVSALSLLPPPPVFSYPCLNCFLFHVDVDSKTLHRCDLMVFIECLLYTRLYELRDTADIPSQLLSCTLWLIHQPRHSRQLGGDWVDRGHAHSEFRKIVFCLEQTTASSFMTHFGTEGSELLGSGRQRQLARWWCGLGDNLYWNNNWLRLMGHCFEPSFRGFCLAHTA